MFALSLPLFPFPLFIFPTSHNSSRRLRYGPTNAHDVVLSERDLEKIQGSAIIRSEAQVAQERERAEKIRAEKQAASDARKKRMKELEKRSALMAKKSDVQIAEEAKVATLKAMAQEKLNDNSDVVKALKSMAARAVAFNVRDQQLKEKEEREKIEAEIDRRLDIKMEIDRIKDIKRREDAEMEKLYKRKEDGKVITEQIEHRRRQRLIEAEMREQEAQQMIATMKKQEEQDRIKQEIKQKEIEKSRLEIMKANEEFLESKKAARAAEIKEMEDLLIYQAKQDKKIAEREAEEAALEAVKKERQAKLLAQQEKAQDSAGKLDELRARRAAEEYERKMRKKEKDDAAKRRAETLELLSSRKKQHEDKLRVAAKEKAMEELEIQQGLAFIKKMDDREAADAAYKQRMADEHRVGLSNQISVRAKARMDGRSDKFADGDKSRQEMIAETNKLSVIRDKMVEDLISKGVNPSYLSEMRTADIGKLINR